MGAVMVYIADKPAGINVLAAYAGAHALGDQTRRTNILADETARRTQAYEANVGSQIEQRNEAIRQMRAAAAQDAAATQARLAAEESAMLGRRLQVAEGIARQEMEANGQLSDGTFSAMRDLMAVVSPDDVPSAEVFQNTPETSAMLAAGISGALSGWRMDTGTMPPSPPGPMSAAGKEEADRRAGLLPPAEPKKGFRIATPEEATQYGAKAGQFGPDGRFYPVKEQDGMSIRTDGRGGFVFEQGPGVSGENEPLGMDVASPSAMIRSIEGILNDPALKSSTGMLSILQAVPGTGAYRVGTRIKQLDGQAFLNAFEALKGGGQITEIEGQKATAAIGRLDSAQRTEDYVQALTELRDLLTLAETRPQGWSDSQSLTEAMPDWFAQNPEVLSFSRGQGIPLETLWGNMDSVARERFKP